ncbi:hypothetical protein BLNAU_24070 [Blattamonas nauphoetae]|uniref:Uncharacterized protein n=1 Tax=Blattamonas nauphoetae TaxID=2049346 RepID=A0ABQ9WPF4_9EUKA|nr:hypothetical protein BLNAU_24070 [Blattamonas nauphoetae]
MTLNPLFINLCINSLPPASLQPVPNTHHPTQPQLPFQPAQPDVSVSLARLSAPSQKADTVIDQRAHRLNGTRREPVLQNYPISEEPRTNMEGYIRLCGQTLD